MLKRSSFWWALVLMTAGCLQAAEAPLGIMLGGHRVHPSHILARYKEPQGQASLQSATLLSNLGLAVRREYGVVPGLVVLDEPRTGATRQAVVPAGPEAQAQLLSARIMELRRSGLFEYAEPDYVQYLQRDPSDARYVDGTLWGLRNDGGAGGVVGADISAREAWDLTTGSTNVIVAVIDTGIRYTHQELRSQMWTNPGEIAGNGLDDDNNGLVDDVFGINALDPDNPSGDPMDMNDHGTHCSGTIGAAANDGNAHVGVSWNVRLMGCKFLGANGGFTEGAIACIGYAVTNGASVLNNSWGGGAYSSALYETIRMAQNRGVLFVASAGNNGEDSDASPAYPAAYDLDGIVSVAALDRGDQLASFSNYGATTVDLGAPGVAIFSSTSATDDSYEFFDGTSMAGPHVTGVAALVRALYPSISLFELKQRLLTTVVPVQALAGVTTTGGRVNAFKALSAEGDGQLEVVFDPRSESVLLPSTTQTVFAIVTDTFGVTNATFRARFIQGLSGPLTFANGGTAPDVQADDFIYSASFVVPTNVTELTIEVATTAPDKNNVTNLVHWFVAAPPLNDYFANAIKISGEGGTVYGNSKYATIELPDEPAHAAVPTFDATLWWVWSPEFDNRALIDTSGTEFDAVVAVYTGNTLATLREVASANDVNGRKQPYLQFDAQRGTTYYLVVGGATGVDRGSMRLRVAPNALPDTLPPVLSFTSPPSGITVTTNKVVVNGVAIDPNEGSGVQQINVRLGTDPVSRPATGTTNWTATFTLKVGENRILASGSDFVRNTSEPISMIVNYMPTTVDNDHFRNAFKVEGLQGAAPADTRNATREYQEPRHADNEGGHSVWYRWVAPQDGVLTVATTNVTFDTLLAVYTGDAVGGLTTVAANDDRVPGSRDSHLTTGVRQGVSYSIAVDGFAAGAGTNLVTYSFEPSAVRQLTVSSSSGGRVKPGSGTYAVGAVVLLTAKPDPGYEFTGWSGDVVGSATANPLSVTLDVDRVLRASFAAVGLKDDFESGGFSPLFRYGFSSGAASNRWFVQRGSSVGGQYAARSGKIGANMRTSLTVSNAMAAGVVSFNYRMSSESSFDTLQFFLNGELKNEWSGDTGWQFHQLVVPEGVNVMEWRYEKDSSLTVGEDAAFIDNLVIPLAPVSTGTAARMQAIPTPAGVALRLLGESGSSYSVEVSSDLIHWTPLATQVGTDAWADVQVAPSSATGARFYRAVQR